jgi:glucan endo-1,3-alpha-glucosidase
MKLFFIKVATVFFITILCTDFLYAQESRRMVVAHYMLGMSMYRDAGEITVAGLKKDIIDAHDQGVDAFQINIGRFSATIRNILDMFFKAASECNFPFYLFLSADYNLRNPNPMRYDEILDFMSLYADHPNYLMVNGRPLFTTWLGFLEGADYWKTIKQQLREELDIDVFYVPWYGNYFGVRGNKNLVISSGRMEQLLEEYEGVIDGFWFWGVDLSPFPVGSETGIITLFENEDKPIYRFGRYLSPEETRPYYIQIISQEGITPSTSIPSGAEILSDVLKKHGMPFMTPVAPAFWATSKEPCKYTEYTGAKGVESQWMSIINNQDARWVNLVTWNDLGEDSHWSPHPEPTSQWGMVHSHAGYAELNKYYIKWWKSGHPPVIEKDKLFYFYRTQFQDAKPLKESCPHDCNYSIPDKVYITTMLTGPARLTIHSGSTTTFYDAPAGVHYWEANMGEGSQRFMLVRGEERIIDVTGGKPVERTPEYKSWSLFSGFATNLP